MLLRARIVLPVCRPPIEDGAVLIADSNILEVKPWSEMSEANRAASVDLGDVILMPGLVNAHCHLDYTHMAGKILPRASFTDWIKAMVALKASWSYTEFADSWLAGARQLLRYGTTTVADMEAVPELIPDMWDTSPLRVISFRELINVKSNPQPARLIEEVEASWGALPQAETRVGLSPHAPYTTTPELLSAAARLAEKRSWLLSTNVAESEEEFQMFMYGAGAMHDWLGPQRPRPPEGYGSPVKYLHRCEYLRPGLLAVHVNYLDRDDASLLGDHGVHVVHCPTSHDYFGHLRFPLRELTAAGVSISLGTDSLASRRKSSQNVPVLSMLAEMRELARVHTGLSPWQILNMATLHGATALGQSGKLGQLSAGARADLIAIPFAGRMIDAVEAVLHHEGEVETSIIDGRWALGRGSPSSE